MINKEKLNATLTALETIRGLADQVNIYFDSIPNAFINDEIQEVIGQLGHIDDIVMNCTHTLKRLGK